MCGNTRIMQHRVIRLRSEEEELIDFLRKIEKPYSIWVKRILPKATHPQFKYLWGVVYKTIADHLGYSQKEVHSALMEEFQTIYEPTGNPLVWNLQTRSASTFSVVEIAEWCEMVSAWAHVELGIHIPEVNEIWENYK